MHLQHPPFTLNDIPLPVLLGCGGRLQLLFRRAELTVLGVSKELDNVRRREDVLRATSGQSSDSHLSHIQTDGTTEGIGTLFLKPTPSPLTVVAIYWPNVLNPGPDRLVAVLVSSHPFPLPADITTSRIQSFSIFSIAILMAVSLWQIHYLKSFFRAKKLL